MFELNPDRKTFIDSVNGRTVIIIDDFYKNPDEVRNLALTSERRRDPKLINGLPGSRVFVETDELKKHVKPFFDELCLSDIWRTNIDEKIISNGTVGPITKEIQANYENAVLGTDNNSRNWLTFIE